LRNKVLRKKGPVLDFTCDLKVTCVSSSAAAGSGPAGAIGSADASHSQARDVRRVRLVRGSREPMVRLFLVISKASSCSCVKEKKKRKISVQPPVLLQGLNHATVTVTVTVTPLA
jgi:hypothetical protein